MAPYGIGLEQILHPVTVSEFLAEHHLRRTVHVPGSPKKFDALFSPDFVDRIVTGDALRVGFKDAAGEHRELSASAEQVPALLAAGMTVMVPRVEMRDAGMCALLRRVRTELCVAEGMDIGCFVSPDGSGFGLHYDSSSMWILQLEGEKRWWVGDVPAVPFPPTCVVADRAMRETEIDESSFREVVLRRGDVLYVPAGTWHRVKAIGRSVHVCVTIFHAPAQAPSLVADALAPLLLADGAWRDLPSLRAPWSSPSGARAQIEAQLARMLRDARSALDRLTPSDLYAAWRARVDAFGDAVAGGDPETMPIGPDERLSRTAHGWFSFAVDPSRDESEGLLLFTRGALIATVPRHALGLARELSRATTFTAREATTYGGDFAWDEVEPVLRVLVATRVLERAR